MVSVGVKYSILAAPSRNSVVVVPSEGLTR